MGNYYFTSSADGSKTKVEYTFGYKKNDDGKESMPKIASVSQQGYPTGISWDPPKPAL